MCQNIGGAGGFVSDMMYDAACSVVDCSHSASQKQWNPLLIHVQSWECSSRQEILSSTTNWTAQLCQIPEVETAGHCLTSLCKLKNQWRANSGEWWVRVCWCGGAGELLGATGSYWEQVENMQAQSSHVQTGSRSCWVGLSSGSSNCRNCFQIFYQTIYQEKTGVQSNLSEQI